MTSRRKFIKTATAGAASAALMTSLPYSLFGRGEDELFFKISLAQWSLNKTIFSGKMDNLDFPSVTKEKFGINAVEYVNQFFPSAGSKYIKELLKRSVDSGVENVLIMIDEEGDLGELYKPKRGRAVERHYPWVEAAKLLGCHSIRVNARGNGSREEVGAAATEGLRLLSEFAKDYGINVIVENHGGYSSDGQWLTKVISDVGMNNCGTLPDFGNFEIKPGVDYDRYQGMDDLMPYAKGVSAKSHNFDSEGNEVNSDYYRILKIVKEHGYTGHIGIEYEGLVLSEEEGIMATKKLLIKAGMAL